MTQAIRKTSFRIRNVLGNAVLVSVLSNYDHIISPVHVCVPDFRHEESLPIKELRQAIHFEQAIDTQNDGTGHTSVRAADTRHDVQQVCGKDAE